MTVANLQRRRKKLRRMRATLATYEQAEAMAAEKARKQRYDIERAEAELVHATNAVREPHFERLGCVS